MNRTLLEVKSDIGAKHLGRSGIHGVGIAESAQAIRLYMLESADNDVLKEIRAVAAPFDVIVVASQQPKLR